MVFLCGGGGAEGLGKINESMNSLPVIVLVRVIINTACLGLGPSLLAVV